MEFKEDKGTGYMYCYAPGHACANKAGKVFEHVFVMSEFIGRTLKDGECVHHKDRDRKNNSLSNLELMSRSEHALLHAAEDRKTRTESRQCRSCSAPFLARAASEQKHCCYKCAQKSRERFSLSAEDLMALVWSMPAVKVAEKLGVSDVAVAKRCKKLGVEKPPRGYWAKISGRKDGLRRNPITRGHDNG